VQHVVIPSAALRRNPHLASSETVQDCPAEMAPEPLKGHGPAARLYPISRNVTTADSHAGTFTAACGVTVFRGTGLPDAYRGGVFSCDPTGNLVHFDRLEPAGATFTARPARPGVEFLASTDNWFRPVGLAHGPDGAVYVCDMYRRIIEHPDYLPVEVRKRTDFEGARRWGGSGGSSAMTPGPRTSRGSDASTSPPPPSPSFARRSSTETDGTATPPTACCWSAAASRRECRWRRSSPTSPRPRPPSSTPCGCWRRSAA
jgi:hypothetical protein